ncbi:IS3 family transposase [Brevibacterium sandarakinum]|uniref:IS3 family transposase n=1 Tax=Brevibacterium sandarakinum TaxID=629680 RepID=UPI001E573BE2|nr:IS3 family transposase [Brevibacterium sandarakinum]
MDPPSRNRCRQQTRQHQRRVRRTTRDASAQSSAGAGERGPTPRGRLSVTGEPAVKRLYPLVRELAADGIPVAVSCRVLKLSRQPYYRWLAAPVPDTDLVEAYRANALFDAHRDDPEFGYRYLADEAEAAGQPMAVRTAWRLCSANDWFSAFGKGRAKNGKKPGPPVHDDLCAVVDADGRTRHEFRADGPNQLWLTDISEHHTNEGKLYLCALKDAYSSRIVGYSISSRMKARLAVDALEMAVTRRGDVGGCVTHSDRGSQFRSKKFTRALARHGIIGSMGRVGAAGDNAAMESFFALLQKNVLDRRRWVTRDQLRIAIVTWIERTYHRRRRQARLGRLTPVEYEAIIEPAALAA